MNEAQKKFLEYISNRIYNYLLECSYDDTTLFEAFKLEMILNIGMFLSPENYNDNIKTLSDSKIEKSSTPSEYIDYLERLKKEINRILQDKCSQDNEPFTKKIMENLNNFLDPYKYEKYIETLKTKQKRKKLTLQS